MDYVLSEKNSFDRSPLSYGKLSYVTQRVKENVDRYVDVRKTQPGRVKSNHLLMALLNSLTIQFGGDLYEYMSKVESQATRNAGVFGLVTPQSRGMLFEGVFYPGCREIITCTRGNVEVMDLWAGWRKVSAITVYQHPVTDLTLFEPGAMNEATLSHTDGIVVLNIDVAVLAAQYLLWKADSYTSSYERFITEIVLPGMIKSHVDVVMFNKVAAALGVIEQCDVKTNLNMMQNDADVAANNLVDDVVNAILGKTMQSRQILDSIPGIYKTRILRHLSDASLLPTNQAMWAKEITWFNAAGVCLEVGQRQGFDRQLELVTRIRRIDTNALQEGWYTNGRTKSNTAYILKLKHDLIDSRMPVTA